MHKTAKRQDERLEDQPRFISGCQYEWANLPKPGKPLTVGIDGGFVQTLDTKPQRRMMRLLRDQGMQENQQITFLSDGADSVRDLQFLMHPESEHILDCFHITMRLTVLNQFAKGMCHTDPGAGAELLKKLASAKWRIWHGKAEQGLERLDDCYCLCDDPELRYQKRRKLARHLIEMMTYIGNNSHLIPNYGEKYRYGETITTAFVESTVNEVVAKRMVKKQQMQWSRQGAHYLLQTRTVVLNGELRDHFEEWYPELSTGTHDEESEVPVKMAA